MTTCRVCGNNDLKMLHDFGMAPVAGYLVDTLQTALTEQKYANYLVFCCQCNLVQQGDDSFKEALIDKVYSNYRPTYSMSVKVRDYMSRFIDEAIMISSAKNEIVLEIGSNDGSMFKKLRAKGLKPAGIDPSASVSSESQEAIVIKDFFSTSVANDFVDSYGKVKLLYSRHTLEHVFNPVDFMKAIDVVLDDNGIAVIEVPYLPAQLSANQYTAMTTQHILFFTLSSLNWLAEKSNLVIINAKPSKMDGGSIIVYFTKSKLIPASNRIKSMLELEKTNGIGCLQELDVKFKLIANEINLAHNHLTRLREHGYNVVGYGAGAKGQALLNMLGLSHDLIPYVVDDTPGSNGMFIPGTGARVIESSDANFAKADCVLITAPTHVDEIVAKEQNNHPSISFIRTSPNFSYVSNL